jgi:hypothetical protein
MQEIGNLFENKTQLNWHEFDYRKRLAMALFATQYMYRKLIEENKVYGLLCSEREGVTKDEILIFCGCVSDNGIIYLSSSDRETKGRLETIANKNCCCPDKRKIAIRYSSFGKADCSIKGLRRSIMKEYSMPAEHGQAYDNIDVDKVKIDNVEAPSSISTLQKDQTFYKFGDSSNTFPYC